MSYSTRHILRWLLLAGLVFVVMLSYPHWSIYFSPFVTIAIMVGPLVLLGLFLNKSKPWLSGAAGEYHVDIELKELPKDYPYRRDLAFVVNKGNIDFLCVGPTGVWTIEVKDHYGKITFDNGKLCHNSVPFEKNFIKQAWAEALSAKEFISKKLGTNILVQPIIVFTNPGAKLNFGLRKIEGVYTIGLPWLNKLILEDCAIQLSEDLILKIKDLLPHTGSNLLA